MTQPRTNNVPATVREWFDALEPSPPDALLRELRHLLQTSGEHPASELPEICMRVAEESLMQLQNAGSNNRASALQLLSIDALVTYAFQGAADDTALIERRASEAMTRISLLSEGAAGR